MGRCGRADGPVSPACGSCGQRRLAAVLIPGHEDVEAVVCLSCGSVQRDVAIARSPAEPDDAR